MHSYSIVPRLLPDCFPVQLQGSITALATPFTASGALDMAAWQALLERQLEAGTQGVVVAGSTGEAAMLTQAEFEQLIASTARLLEGRIPLLAGAGCSGTAHTIEQCQRAAQAGADAVLVVTPPYVRPTQDGLRRHYEAVAEAVTVPVVLYNVPVRTGVDILPQTVAALAAHARIIGIKEAVAQMDRIDSLRQHCGKDFRVLGGDDGTACEAQLRGADGVISVLSNLLPAAFRRLCDLARGGQHEQARALDAHLQPLYPALGLEPNPVPLKALMAELGLCHDVLRLPLLPLSSPHRAAAAEATGQLRRLLQT